MKLKKLPLFVIAFLFLLPIPTFASSIKVYFSLVDDPGAAIIEQLNKAEESIDIATYYFTDRDLAKQPITEKIVYITKTAKKYYRANCKYLRKSKIPIILSEAIKREYTPCSVCKPDPPVELNNKSNLVIPLKEKILIKKPTVIIPNLKVESTSNSWGQISLDTTTINTEILVNDPNFYLIPIKVDCDIYLNDIKMVSGLGKDLEITRSASGSLIRFTSTIDNENVIKWWVSHIKIGEKTKYYFQYRFWIKPFIKSRWQKTYGTFKTDIFSRSVGACHMKK